MNYFHTCAFSTFKVTLGKQNYQGQGAKMLIVGNLINDLLLKDVQRHTKNIPSCISMEYIFLFFYIISLLIIMLIP